MFNHFSKNSNCNTTRQALIKFEPIFQQITNEIEYSLTTKKLNWTFADAYKVSIIIQAKIDLYLSAFGKNRQFVLL